MRNPDATRGSAADLKGNSRLQKQQSSVTTFEAAVQPQNFDHHVDADRRRIKTLEELRDGLELAEIYDRFNPGRLVGRRRT
jgi:hypothetical protein